MKAIFILIFLFVYSGGALAEQNHKLIRRITVFPISAKSDYKKSTEKVWWKIREKLTLDKRFLVASRNFLIKKDVFQQRKSLKPADAIILGQLLDAHSLITTFLKGRVLHMHAYETVTGLPLWTSKLNLHPSIPVAEQISDASLKLTNDFMASIPYQGYLYLDKFIGKSTYQKGADHYIKAKLSELSNVKVGDLAQVIRLKSNTFDPLFSGSVDIEVVAEGRIREVEKHGVVSIQLERHLDIKKLNEFDLVRIPSEYKRISNLFKINNGLTDKIGSEYFSPEVTEESRKVKERKPLVAALTFILNIAAFLLIAL